MTRATGVHLTMYIGADQLSFGFYFGNRADDLKRHFVESATRNADWLAELMEIRISASEITLGRAPADLSSAGDHPGATGVGDWLAFFSAPLEADFDARVILSSEQASTIPEPVLVQRIA